MSQYPPNPNYNPYGQNPSNPDQNPGTAYGGPPSGPNPNPYNPSAPGTNPNPYGPYEQNPPTPAPPPYDPYAQTVASTNPNYSPYTFPPTIPPSKPPAPARRGPSMRAILIAAIALVLVIGGIAFGFVSYNNAQQSNANATATAQANANAAATARANANATATAAAKATATAIATTFPFSANRVLNDPLSDNSQGHGWESNDSCKFQANAYHVIDSQANTFNFCSATNTDFQNFTFQVEALLLKGDGLGITFRGNAKNNQIYRFTVFNDNSYGLVAYVDPTGTNARVLTSGTVTPAPNLSNTNTFAVVARGSSLTLYFNQAIVATFNDSTYTHGQIGVEVDNATGTADAVFTNAQVWSL